MAIVKINEINIRLDADEIYYEIDDSFYGYPTIRVEFLEIDEKKLKKIIFIGFPLNSNSAKNISLSELRKLKIKGNNALQTFSEVIHNSFEHDYFFIATHGIDPIGIEFLKKLPAAFNELNKRIFIIGHQKTAIDLNFEWKLPSF